MSYLHIHTFVCVCAYVYVCVCVCVCVCVGAKTEEVALYCIAVTLQCDPLLESQ